MATKKIFGENRDERSRALIERQERARRRTVSRASKCRNDVGENQARLKDEVEAVNLESQKDEAECYGPCHEGCHGPVAVAQRGCGSLREKPAGSLDHDLPSEADTTKYRPRRDAKQEPGRLWRPGLSLGSVLHQFFENGDVGFHLADLSEHEDL